MGNPGRKYAQNRHNAGWLAAQALPFCPSLSWQKKFNGLYAIHDGIHFLMPQTFMNRSGVSVQAASAFYKIKIEDIIIVHDELELPLGCVSLKFSGGLGGHNGLRSMRDSFGSVDFWRLRIGLGRPEAQAASQTNPGVYDWVLSDFTEAEQETLIPTLDAAANLLTQTFSCDPESLLKEWAKKKIEIPKPQESIKKEVL